MKTNEPYIKCELCKKELNNMDKAYYLEVNKLKDVYDHPQSRTIIISGVMCLICIKKIKRFIKK